MNGPGLIAATRSNADSAAKLKKRTLTNLHNEMPICLKHPERRESTKRTSEPAAGLRL